MPHSPTKLDLQSGYNTVAIHYTRATVCRELLKFYCNVFVICLQINDNGYHLSTDVFCYVANGIIIGLVMYWTR